MGSHRVEPDRRSPRPGRPAEIGTSRSAGPRLRVLGRAGVLVALVAATVVVPVAQSALANGGSVIDFIDPADLPSTVDALSLVSGDRPLPASLQAAGTLADRDVDEASRDLDRGDSVLPGCTGVKPAVSAPNGELPDSALCTLWDGHTRVRADYAVALAQLNQVYVATFGVDMCMTSGYRSLADQRAVKAEKGYLAATPGKSNHGLGLAVDFCTEQLGNGRFAWLKANGPRFGIDNPPWASTEKYEPWHWEFTQAVAEDNSYTGSTAND